MKRRFCALALAIYVLAGLVGCGGRQKANSHPNPDDAVTLSPSASPSTAPTPTPTATPTIESTMTPIPTPTLSPPPVETTMPESTPEAAQNTHKGIPKKLVNTSTELWPEYLPSVTFHTDMSCNFLQNFGSKMDTATTTYQVYGSSGSYAIACDYADGTKGWFFEGSNGHWTYGGQEVGLTYWKNDFVPENGETVDVATTIYSAANLFAHLSGREFIFSSGVGGWSTSLSFDKSGTFSGVYFDTDYGMIDDGYDATVYQCGFEGNFSKAEKVDDFTYRLHLEKLNAPPAGGEEIVDGVLYIDSDPYGMTDGDVFYLYLPGHPTATLPEDYMEWIRHSFAWREDEVPSHLTFWGLYNVHGSGCFTSEF